jgi:hypothetical protein
MKLTTNTRWEATQRVMAAKLIRLTHKMATQLHLVAERPVPFAVLASGGQSGNFWIHPRIRSVEVKLYALFNLETIWEWVASSSGSMARRYVNILPHRYTVSQPRRLRLRSPTEDRTPDVLAILLGRFLLCDPSYLQTCVTNNKIVGSCGNHNKLSCCSRMTIVI